MQEPRAWRANNFTLFFVKRGETAQLHNAQTYITHTQQLQTKHAAMKANAPHVAALLAAAIVTTARARPSMMDCDDAMWDAEPGTTFQPTHFYQAMMAEPTIERDGSTCQIEHSVAAEGYVPGEEYTFKTKIKKSLASVIKITNMATGDIKCLAYDSKTTDRTWQYTIPQGTNSDLKLSAFCGKIGEMHKANDLTVSKKPPPPPPPPTTTLSKADKDKNFQKDWPVSFFADPAPEQNPKSKCFMDNDYLTEWRSKLIWEGKNADSTHDTGELHIPDSCNDSGQQQCCIIMKVDGGSDHYDLTQGYEPGKSYKIQYQTHSGNPDAVLVGVKPSEGVQAGVITRDQVAGDCRSGTHGSGLAIVEGSKSFTWYPPQRSAGNIEMGIACSNANTAHVTPNTLYIAAMTKTISPKPETTTTEEPKTTTEALSDEEKFKKGWPGSFFFTPFEYTYLCYMSKQYIDSMAGKTLWEGKKGEQDTGEIQTVHSDNCEFAPSCCFIIDNDLKTNGYTPGKEYEITYAHVDNETVLIGTNNGAAVYKGDGHDSAATGVTSSCGPRPGDSLGIRGSIAVEYRETPKTFKWIAPPKDSGTVNIGIACSNADDKYKREEASDAWIYASTVDIIERQAAVTTQATAAATTPATTAATPPATTAASGTTAAQHACEAKVGGLVTQEDAGTFFQTYPLAQIIEVSHQCDTIKVVPYECRRLFHDNGKEQKQKDAEIAALKPFASAADTLNACRTMEVNVAADKIQMMQEAQENDVLWDAVQGSVNDDKEPPITIYYYDKLGTNYVIQKAPDDKTTIHCADNYGNRLPQPGEDQDNLLGHTFEIATNADNAHQELRLKVVNDHNNDAEKNEGETDGYLPRITLECYMQHESKGQHRFQVLLHVDATAEACKNGFEAHYLHSPISKAIETNTLDSARATVHKEIALRVHESFNVDSVAECMEKFQLALAQNHAPVAYRFIKPDSDQHTGKRCELYIQDCNDLQRQNFIKVCLKNDYKPRNCCEEPYEQARVAIRIQGGSDDDVAGEGLQLATNKECAAKCTQVHEENTQCHAYSFTPPTDQPGRCYTAMNKVEKITGEQSWQQHVNNNAQFRGVQVMCTPKTAAAKSSTKDDDDDDSTNTTIVVAVVAAAVVVFGGIATAIYCQFYTAQNEFAAHYQALHQNLKNSNF